MIKFLALLFVFWAFTSCGPTLKDKTSGNATNSKTINYRKVPGTKVFIDLPNDYKTSTSLPAFLKGEEAVIQAIDLVGGNFYKNTASFTKEKFEQNGLKVFEFREFIINKYPAKMVLLQGDQENKMYSLVFGDSTFSASINGVFALKDTLTKTQIQKAFQSIYYDKTLKINPFETALFQLDDTKSIFKFSDFSASIYTYLEGGENKESKETDPRFLVVTRPTDGASLKAIADESVGLIDIETIKNVSLDKINGLDSFKRVIYGNIEGRPSALFQQIVLIDENAIVMQGIAGKNSENYILEFEKLANTIKLK